MPRRPLAPILGSLLALTLALAGCGDDDEAAVLDPKTEAYCADAVQLSYSLRARRRTPAEERSATANTAAIAERMQENVPAELADAHATITEIWTRLSATLEELPENTSASATIRKLQDEPVYAKAVADLTAWVNDTCVDES